MTNERLDKALVSRGMVDSRTSSQNEISSGNVLVDGKSERKASFLVGESQTIEFVTPPSPTVSRASEKLAHALTTFKIDVTGLRALDIGASTGGFTQCLLNAGAQSVMAIDVGHSQMNAGIAADPRVTVREGLNARYIVRETFETLFDIIVIDVSFISLSHILPAATNVLEKDGIIVALIKPQFEVGHDKISKDGIVKKPVLHQFAIQNVRTAAAGCKLRELGLTESPLFGGDGNKEFLISLSFARETAEDSTD